VVGFPRIPCRITRPQGIKISVDNTCLVKIEGVDKKLVGQVCGGDPAAIRPPEPTKSKGSAYRWGEQVRRRPARPPRPAKIAHANDS